MSKRPAIRLDDAGSDTNHISDPRWRPDPNKDGELTWQRYRGQCRRGRISQSDADDRDLSFVLREISEGKAMLREAYAVADARQRREAVKSALARVALGTRAADELLERRLGSAADCMEEP